MAKRIYVGGLPYSATEEDLESLFAAAGKVTDTVIVTDRYTGQARGFGFVEMASDDEADKAISQLNGAQMGGRTLTVNEAKPRDDRPGGGGGGGGRGGSGGGGGGRGGDRYSDKGFGSGGGRW
ncbi:MAG: RNA-binding protein [Armatimonadetes bacterium]|nr:RNA-binding protein [Armatimonadota bacterium]MDE2207901.1 RNA-binding protein [Armatimonadota bacterium]